MAPLVSLTTSVHSTRNPRHIVRQANLTLPITQRSPTSQENVAANPIQKVPGVTIAFIITCAVLTLMLGIIIIWLYRLWQDEKTVAEPREPEHRFRMPKLPDFRGQVAKGIEALSWKMESGHTSSEVKDADRTERVSFDESTWGTPSRNARNSRHSTAPQTSSGTGSQQLPWDVPACRFSCPAALGASDTDFHLVPDSMLRSTSVSLTLDRPLSRFGTPTLETIDEEECDMFVGQRTLDEGCLVASAYRDSATAAYQLTEGESMSTIINLTAAGMRSAEKRENASRNLTRRRQDSNASASTGTSESAGPASSSDGGSQNSSNTSINTMITDTSSLERDDELSESDMAEIFEARKVTNSMEVGKAILVALPKSRSAESIPDMVFPVPSPALLMAQHDFSDDTSNASVFANTKIIQSDFLHPTMLPDSSSSSLQTAGSICTVDLEDFPMPPIQCALPSITFTHSTDSGFVTFPYQ
ncbi:hypothetical protein FIBSPDRAFT_864386 [Athelia psychrophila]|uniref:Uncharacterized protein n=1 Tax=Athelia psychrophila TaxID=1759441 RepID=A0A166GMJ0_9AGAM|nr:hypothetical protein FIBSPDRAFT_864386 [Fibularhizoctonia sp. CBS 109695]